MGNENLSFEPLFSYLALLTPLGSSSHSASVKATQDTIDNRVLSPLRTQS